MSRTIIAFAGSKGSGKTTSFETVLSNFDGVTELMFAKKLKDICTEIFSLDPDRLNDQAYKESYFEDPIRLERVQIEQIITYFGYPLNYDKDIRRHSGMMLETPRQLLQYVGTDLLHGVDKEIHIKSILDQIPEDGMAVITDLRFEQEFDYFEKNYPGEFFPFYIKNSSAELAAEGDTHPSETQLQNFKNKCCLIDNNFTLQELKDKVINNVKDIL